MTDVSDNLETGKPEPRRDQYNRAMLLNKSGARVPYTRASTIAKTLDSQEGLINYEARLACVGLTRRKDLHDMTASLRDPEGVDKPEMRNIAEQAAIAGGKGVKANLGTARHKFSEMLDEGTPINQVLMPDDIRRDLDAYVHELDRVGLRPLPQYCEVHAVRDEFDYNGAGVSGSWDKTLGDGSDLFIADMKTGQEVKYAMLAWSVQQAIYANMEHIYDVRTDTRHEMPNVRKDVAFIIWLPAGQGRCQVLEIDIANGWRYAQLAVEVRRARAHGKRDLGRDGGLVRHYEPIRQLQLAPVRGDDIANLDGHIAGQTSLLSPLPADGNAAPAVTPVETVDTERRRKQWLRDRLKAASIEYRNLVAGWWVQWNERAEAPIPPLNNDSWHHNTVELDRIEAWCNEAEAQLQETFSADPTVVAAHAVLKQFPGTIDEGTEVSAAELTALSANLGLWCRPAWLGLMNGWRDEAIRLGHDFGIKECSTTRRLKLYELGANLCNIAEGDPDNIEVCWAVLITALGWPAIPDTPFGLAFSLLSMQDIDAALDVVAQPDTALHYDATTGLPTWRPVTNEPNS